MHLIQTALQKLQEAHRQLHEAHRQFHDAHRLPSLRRYAGKIHSAIHLVCFPWACAGASGYRRFAPLVPDSVELLAVQYPGREDRFREAPVTRMDQLVSQLVRDLSRIIDDRPMVFFGHSMGALVAYETAQALKARYGQEPALLVVSGSGAPGTPGTYVRPAPSASDDELIEDVRRLGGTPRELLEDRQTMKAFLPVMRADYELLDAYQPAGHGPLSCPVVACAGDQDTSVSRETVEAWFEHTRGERREHWFKGDHFYLCSEPASLTQQLAEWMGQTVTK
jgi:surfactin synthase thioesterase subunit